MNVGLIPYQTIHTAALLHLDNFHNLRKLRTDMKSDSIFELFFKTDLQKILSTLSNIQNCQFDCGISSLVVQNHRKKETFNARSPSKYYFH